MKSKLLLFMAIFALAFSACSDDDPTEDNDKDKITVSATIQCKSGDSYIPDVGAALYLFKDFRDYANYEYQNGTYVNKTTGDIRQYTQKAVANSDGVATMKVEYGQYSLVVWESAKYPGKHGQNIYLIEKGQEPIHISEIYFAP